MKYEIPNMEPGMASEPFDKATPKEHMNDVFTSDIVKLDNRFSLSDSELREVAAKSIENVREGKFLRAERAMNYFNSL